MKPGDRFGPYDIVGALGAGGMGVVFRARDTRLGREVALKTLPAASQGDSAKVKRFELEAQAASALNHPNVLSVYDVGQHGDTPFLVTELLEGQTLRERLLQGPLSPRKAIDVAAQVARGLAAVHEKGIVHRDLKPDNLFLTADGRVKILDFGVSRTLEAETPPVAGTLPLTQSGAVMGTAGYMAPEQVRGRPADARSDVFALGAILYELVTGDLAFPGETPVERGYAILNGDPPQKAKVPAALDRIVRRCLEKSPAERFQLAQDLAFALDAVAEGSGDAVALAAPAPVAKRPRALLLVAALALPAAGAALGFALGESSVAQPEPPRAAPTFQRVTFRNGLVSTARFSTGGRALVYAGLLEGGPLQVYAGGFDTANARPVSAANTALFDVSPQDELALGALDLARYTKGMVLSRQALSGGGARQVLTGVLDADFGPDGQSMAVVRHTGAQTTLEYPVGTVLLTTPHMLRFARVSPTGQHLAFARHPVPGDDRGTVEIIDLTGKPVATSRDWWTLEGVAWNADGTEVWFSAAETSAERALQALSLEGEGHEVLAVPGSLVLHDVAADGRALVGIGLGRSRMFGRVPGSQREQPLAWFDGSSPVDLSADGQALLFLEGLGAGKLEVQTYLRVFDGSLPFHVGTGWGRALSPDKQWAILSPKAPFNTLSLVPTGPGQSIALPPGELTGIHAVRYFADGKRIAIGGHTQERKAQLFLQRLDQPQQAAEGAAQAPAPVPLGPPGLSLTSPPSPDGRWLGASDEARRPVLVDTATGQTRQLPGLLAGDFVTQWADDGKAALVLRKPDRANPLQLQVLKYDLTTQQQTTALEIAPVDTVGLGGIAKGVLTPDARHYVYSTHQRNDELYVVGGLR